MITWNVRNNPRKFNIKAISDLLARRQLEGYLVSNDLNIFPLTKSSKSKYLQPKDFVEIAIRY